MCGGGGEKKGDVGSAFTSRLKEQRYSRALIKGCKTRDHVQLLARQVRFMNSIQGAVHAGGSRT
jgi:hypothetical protein